MSLAVWAVIVSLIVINALYVAAEFGAVGVRRSRIKRMSDDGHRLARVLLPHIQDPKGLDRYVAVSQIGITLSGLVLGAYAQATVAVSLAPRLTDWFALDSSAAVSAAAISVLLVLTAVQVVLSELIPKSLALQFPTQVALATVMPMRWSLAAFGPFITVLNGSATGLLKLVGVDAGTHRHIHSPDEIELLIVESRDGGLLEPDEHRRLHRALRLGLRTAGDLMVPVSKLTMLQVDTPWEEVVQVVASSPFSRLPVYRETPRDIIGTLRVKDLVYHYVVDGQGSPLETLVRTMVRVPATLSADRVIGLLRERRAHQAAVTDSVGHVVGLVTIQDVVGAFLDPVGSRTEGPA
ncbi:MAG: HlyC/CorC family transporter [Acidobacteria bacterium]|jgi:putative hemolysin|nr:HlyC/CorC family transporter [Acidobacteriota bacterium]